MPSTRVAAIETGRPGCGCSSFSWFSFLSLFSSSDCVPASFMRRELM